MGKEGGGFEERIAEFIGKHPTNFYISAFGQAFRRASPRGGGSPILK